MASSPLELRTVFLDRDGVINRKAPEGHYVTCPNDLEILAGVPEAIARLTSKGITVAVVTNQQGVAKGLMSLGDVDRVNSIISSAVEAKGGYIEDFLVCPHLEGTCNCRKPKTGLFMEARRRNPDICFATSVVIGDSISDMAAARKIGATGIRIGTDDAAEFPGLPQAVEAILRG